MKMAQQSLVCVVLCALMLQSYGQDETYSIYETPLKIEADGFPVESHHVTTEDGYILEMHRIPHGRQLQDTSPGRPVIFLMHGLLSASNAFVAIGPEQSVAYNLADAGFDVWMGNARGNKNSRYHVTLDPDDASDKTSFFDFSFEEIGMLDVPAMVDYVLEFTGQDQLHYIGHSQGGTVFLVLCSMIPEYNAKFRSVHLLAGVGYMEYFPNTQLSTIAAMTDIIYTMGTAMGIVELYPPNSTEMINIPGFNFDQRRSDACTGNVANSYFCEVIGMRHIMRDDDNTNSSESSIAVGGGSLKQIAHYGQNIRDKRFRRYHHGIFSNLSVYGSTAPPNYNLTLITAKVTMHYTVNDNLLDERDVLAMAADMPNTVVRKVARETFLHEDFAVAEDAKELVTDFIIEAIKEEAGWSGNEINEQENEDSAAELPVSVVDGPVSVVDPVTASASMMLSAFYLIMCSLVILV